VKQKLAAGNTVGVGEYSLLPDPIVELDRQIPGSVNYHTKRFLRPATWVDEAGQLRYIYKKESSSESLVELRFCTVGQFYCPRQADCRNCALVTSRISPKAESVDFQTFTFSHTLLQQFASGRLGSVSLNDGLTSLQQEPAFTRTLSLCTRTRQILDGLLHHHYSGSLENIYVNAQAQMLLLYALDCMDEKAADYTGCKFLTNEADRGKIAEAREILLRHIGDPLTIKELSRKVAMNECYLKKGFKELYGTTIFEFYQSQRMEHAKYLLYEKGLTVTEVSMLLGYSSISHFSTAFKKHTGLKPCELLLR
jgi:AraC family transcriptional regulator